MACGGGITIVPSSRQRSAPVLLLSFVLTACGSQGAHLEQRDSTAEWPTGHASEAGFDMGALDMLASDIEAGGFPNTHALLIEHDGVLVFEQ
jgi:hypothetical protein